LRLQAGRRGWSGAMGIHDGVAGLGGAGGGR
jgi:hypothetical protein